MLGVGPDKVPASSVDLDLRLVGLGGPPLLLRLVTEPLHWTHVLIRDLGCLHLGQGLGEVGVDGLVEGLEGLEHVPRQPGKLDGQHRLHLTIPPEDVGSRVLLGCYEHGPHVLEQQPQLLVGKVGGRPGRVLLGYREQPLGVLAPQAKPCRQGADDVPVGPPYHLGECLKVHLHGVRPGRWGLEDVSGLHLPRSPCLGGHGSHDLVAVDQDDGAVAEHLAHEPVLLAPAVKVDDHDAVEAHLLHPDYAGLCQVLP